MNLLTSRTTALIAAAVLGGAALAGCGGSADDTASDTAGATTDVTASTPATDGAAEPTTPVSQKPAPIDIELTLTGTKVEPAPGTIKVEKGSTVSITVDRDSNGEIHVHGYDIAVEGGPGPVTLEFTADETGVFEVESHHPDVLLTKIQVR